MTIYTPSEYCQIFKVGKKKVIGVYKLQSKCKPERIYIGSSVNVTSRISVHYSAMLYGYSTIKLIDHFIEHGRIDFEASIIEECSIDVLRERERYYINLYKPYFNEQGVNRDVPYKNNKGGSTWNEIIQRHEKLLEIRKKIHKEHMAKYQNI